MKIIHALIKKCRYLYLLFEAEITEGEVEISEEHTDFLWVSFETVKNNLDKLLSPVY
jgi:hypothetical protein